MRKVGDRGGGGLFNTSEERSSTSVVSCEDHMLTGFRGGRYVGSSAGGLCSYE